VTVPPAISPKMTEPSAIATGPSGNRNPVATTRTSAIAYFSLVAAAMDLLQFPSTHLAYSTSQSQAADY
jgi:hypothetical protein